MNDPERKRLMIVFGNGGVSMARFAGSGSIDKDVQSGAMFWICGIVGVAGLPPGISDLLRG